jgi:putative transposase
MPRPWRITYAGARYHITSRGNGRQRIFLGPEDYVRFVGQLTAALEADEVILYAYVLMPNHTHLLIETPLGNVKRFMQRLNTAYSMYFRYKHNRPGHCFQGRYGAKLVGGDDYIARLTRYIHLNPIKTRKMQAATAAQRIKDLETFKWSSLPGYMSKAEESDIVDYRWLALMGCRTQKGNRSAYRRYMLQMATKVDEEFKGTLGASRYAIGDERFVEEAESDLKEMRLAKACGGGDVYRPRERIAELADIEMEVAKEFQVEPDVLHEHGHKAAPAKNAAVYLSCQLTAKSQRSIGEHFGYTSDSSVVKLRQRFKAQMAEDEKLTKRIIRLRKRILKLYSIIKV